MLKRLFILLFASLLPLTLFGQIGYYATDTSLHLGVKVLDGGKKQNARLVQVKVKENVLEFTPNQLKEYGLSNGRVYVSRDIRTGNFSGKVFLERVKAGKTNLYYYSAKNVKTYFLEKDSAALVELPRRRAAKEGAGFNQVLAEQTADCPAVADAAKLVGYRNSSLDKFVNRYNNCVRKPFPVFRYGLMAGYRQARFYPAESVRYSYLDLFDYEYRGGYTVGLFADIPILLSDFSLHTELYYSRHGFSYSSRLARNDVDFVTNISTFNLPVLFRYALPWNKVRPFLNAGACLTYNLKNESALYDAAISQGVVEIKNVDEVALVSERMAGYAVGGGIEYKLNYKHALFLELRTNQLQGMPDKRSFKSSEFLFITGINF